MRILGIDYGSKRIGVALSNEEETIAFPEAVFENDKMVLGRITALLWDRGVEEIVLGASIDFKGEDNPVMKEIRLFKEVLEKDLSIPIVFEPEYLTSALARRSTDQKNIDASAAALILQSYLDRKRNTRNS